MRALLLLIITLFGCNDIRLDMVSGAEPTWEDEIARRSAARRIALAEKGVGSESAARIDACLANHDRRAAIQCIRGKGPGGRDLRVLDHHGHVTGLSVTVAQCLDLWAAHQREVLDGCN